MIIKNGIVFSKDNKFTKADLAFENGIITEITTPDALSGDDIYDADGAYILPGFVDIHTHGCVNSDFCDGDADGLKKMLAYYGSIGVTTVVFATMAYGEEKLSEIIRTALPYFKKSGYGAVLGGINMEGPFFSVEKRGAQNPDYIINPNEDFFDNLYRLANGYIKILDIAPETKNALPLIADASKKCTVSLAHTATDYQTAAAAFNAGATHVTHLFNGMPPYNHREPGLIGAAYDFAARVEMITDGVHLHPSVVRAMFAMFGADRICLISDSMRGTGMPDGEYDLGGQTVILKDGHANLKIGGSIAGSATDLPTCCRRAVRFGIPLCDVIKAATLNPAKAIGMEKEIGTLEAGKNADILIWNQDLSTKAVFVKGILLCKQ